MSVTRKVGQDSTVVTFDQAIYDIVKRKSDAFPAIGYHTRPGCQFSNKKKNSIAQRSQLQKRTGDWYPKCKPRQEK